MHINTHVSWWRTQNCKNPRAHASKPMAYAKQQRSGLENLCDPLKLKFYTVLLGRNGQIPSLVRFLLPVCPLRLIGVPAVNETPVERNRKTKFFLRAVNWNVLTNCPFNASIKLWVLPRLGQNFTKTCLLAHNSGSPPPLHSSYSQVSSPGIPQHYDIISC